MLSISKENFISHVIYSIIKGAIYCSLGQIQKKGLLKINENQLI